MFSEALMVCVSTILGLAIPEEMPATEVVSYEEIIVYHTSHVYDAAWYDAFPRPGKVTFREGYEDLADGHELTHHVLAAHKIVFWGEAVERLANHVQVRWLAGNCDND